MRWGCSVALRLLQSEQAAKSLINLGGECRGDAAVSMLERCRVGEPDPGQVNGAAARQIAGQRQKYAWHIAVCAAVDQHDDGVRPSERVGADHQDPDPPAAEGVVENVAARRLYHAALNSANVAASSPVREACQSVAAATARRSR